VTAEAFFAAVFSILLGQELLTFQLVVGGSLLLGAVYYVTTKGQGAIQDVVERFT
jgi:drug/metabolite transporter (DMT)-like permease